MPVPDSFPRRYGGRDESSYTTYTPSRTTGRSSYLGSSAYTSKHSSATLPPRPGAYERKLSIETTPTSRFLSPVTRVGSTYSSSGLARGSSSPVRAGSVTTSSLRREVPSFADRMKPFQLDIPIEREFTSRFLNKARGDASSTGLPKSSYGYTGRDRSGSRELGQSGLLSSTPMTLASRGERNVRGNIITRAASIGPSANGRARNGHSTHGSSPSEVNSKSSVSSSEAGSSNVSRGVTPPTPLKSSNNVESDKNHESLSLGVNDQCSNGVESNHNREPATYSIPITITTTTSSDLSTAAKGPSPPLVLTNGHAGEEGHGPPKSVSMNGNEHRARVEEKGRNKGQSGQTVLVEHDSNGNPVEIDSCAQGSSHEGIIGAGSQLTCNGDSSSNLHTSKLNHHQPKVIVHRFKVENEESPVKPTPRKSSLSNLNAAGPSSEPAQPLVNGCHGVSPDRDGNATQVESTKPGEFQDSLAGPVPVTENGSTMRSGRRESGPSRPVPVYVPIHNPTTKKPVVRREERTTPLQDVYRNRPSPVTEPESILRKSSTPGVPDSFRKSTSPAPALPAPYRKSASPAPAQDNYRKSSSPAPVQDSYRKSSSPAPVQDSYRKSTSPGPVQDNYRKSASPGPGVQDNYRKGTSPIHERKSPSPARTVRTYTDNQVASTSRDARSASPQATHHAPTPPPLPHSPLVNGERHHHVMDSGMGGPHHSKFPRSSAGSSEKSGETRRTAHSSSDSSDNDSDIYTASPTLGGRFRSSRDKRSEEKDSGLNGLRNIGNTCFMNSVIQCLSNTKPLLEYLNKKNYSTEINTSTSSMKGALMKSFAQVIHELWRDTRSVVDTSAFKDQVQRFAPRFMGYSQQDAQEFLRYLLEGLHEDVNRVTTRPKPISTEIDDSWSDSQKSTESWKRYLRSDDSKVVDLFVGQLKSTLKCTTCGHCSVTFDPFWDLSLPIPSRTGQVRLSQCLELFTKEEILDGEEQPTCAKCATRRKCTKSFSIQKFPKILVIHLKRFSPTERYRGKLSTTIDFPLNGLDMTPYAAVRSSGCVYNLYGVANHSGSTYSGHYIAYCKHPYNGDWYCYNDSRVSPMSTQSVVSSDGYVLFYELSNSSSHL